MTAAFNRELGLKINREVWNGRQLDKIAEYFAEDFVADYSPAFVWRGRQDIREAVERAHATFAGSARRSRRSSLTTTVSLCTSRSRARTPVRGDRCQLPAGRLRSTRSSS
jgi:ketosteroid isomerase-like protein